MGQEFKSITRTITESDVTLFGALSGDLAEHHVSIQVAESAEFGGRIAHGLLVLSYGHGLMLGSGLVRTNVIAFLGIENWNFRAPVALGDTIHVVFRVAELRVSRSNPDRGVLGFDVEILNQRDEVVQSGRQNLLLRTGKEAA
ncbi:MaoC/PaaZ C-terminal domain-containing protein [Rhodococcus sp. IEGM 1381]|uniref:MaoC/PaaZ C-terminal domain-containing protein n=1 Tax=Rhodococcus sp. IEGM 1381 TaxID=3047085 RepID=UPI0024B85694|nr:MaoC/PaaZ C-terminal domain-containing protein [Rhodococcus sp. IEGM 1381]MDI9897462.1 MaoC/PaaZ C-terminal domain-containing protein [Rhodococcus sp. IEGM 1381]